MNITNDKVTEYINGFYKPLTPQLGQLREEAEQDRVPIILKETESYLFTLLTHLKPKRILEIGTAVAYSTMFFAEVCGDCHIDTIEFSEKNFEIASSNVEKFGMQDKISIHLGDGAEQTEKLREQGAEAYDLVFIDASKSHYKEFWEAAIKLCKNGSIIISDNVLMKAMTASDEYDTKGRYKTNIRRMREYVEFIHQLDYCKTSVMAIGDGIAFSVIDNL